MDATHLLPTELDTAARAQRKPTSSWLVNLHHIFEPYFGSFKLRVSVYAVTTEVLQVEVITFLVFATLGWTENFLFTAAAFFIRYLRWKHWFGSAILLLVVK